MSGHSKWANIKHRKGAQDAKRAKLFTKVAREIMVAARAGGGDHTANSRLRAAIGDARSANMPNERIDKAVKKGIGETTGALYEEVLYEGYGPGGVAVHIAALTDNRNRTTAEVRHLFTKHGGDLGSPGSVAWMFERKGWLVVLSEGVDEDALLEIVLEAGGEDMGREEDSFEILTSPESYQQVRDALEARGIAIASGEVGMQPQNVITVDADKAESVISLLEALDDLDDVQKVAANLEISSAASL